MFQLCESWSISSFTHLLQEYLLGGMIFIPLSLGSHWSLVIWVSLSLPIRLTIPLFSNSSPNSTSLQTGDVSAVKTMSNKFPLGQYRALRTLAHRLLGFCNRRQACLARRLSLNKGMSQNPKPPFSLAFVRLSQASQCTFLLFSSSPHQNSRMSF